MAALLGSLTEESSGHLLHSTLSFIQSYPKPYSSPSIPRSSVHRCAPQSIRRQRWSSNSSDCSLSDGELSLLLEVLSNGSGKLRSPKFRVCLSSEEIQRQSTMDSDSLVHLPSLTRGKRSNSTSKFFPQSSSQTTLRKRRRSSITCCQMKFRWLCHGKQKKKKWSKGKQKEKVNNMVLLDKATYDKIFVEASKYKLTTPFVLSDRMRVNGSVARRMIKELEIKGLIRKELQDRGAKAKASNEEMLNIRKEIVDFHGEMVLLENYSALNYTGLVKILKKYDKRTGALIRSPFIQKVLQQPFFTTDLLYKLVKECELMLDMLFPTEEPSLAEPCGPTISGNTADPTTNESDSSLIAGPKELAEREFMESLYMKSTVSALRALKEMRSGSSTVSVFSLPPLQMSEVEETWRKIPVMEQVAK